MASRKLPQSMLATLRVLRRCRDMYVATPVAAERAVGVDVFAQLNPSLPEALLTKIEREAGEASVAKAVASPLIAARQGALARMRMLVSHFHQVLDFAVARGVYEPGVRAHYGRPLGGGALPLLVTEAQVEAEADRIVRGEVLRMVAEGALFVGMVNPSAGEVGGQFSAFRSAKFAALPAEKKADDEAKDVSDLLAEAIALATDIFDSVEFFYRKEKDGASFRRNCRRWGVEYSYGPGETPDEPAPGAPGAISPVQGPAGSRQVSFTYAGVALATGYRLYGRGPGQSAGVLLAQTDGLQVQVTLDNATSGEDWIFTLRAFNDTGEGPPSPEVAAALP